MKTPAYISKAKRRIHLADSTTNAKVSATEEKAACEDSNQPMKQSKQHNTKGPATRQGLFDSFKPCWSLLERDYVGRTGTFFPLSDLELDLLPLIERCVTGCLDLRVVDKQIITAVIRCNKTISLT